MGERLTAFLDHLCLQERLIWAVFAIAMTFLVVQLLYLGVADVEPALYVVSVMNVAGFTVFAIASGVLMYYCRRRY